MSFIKAVRADGHSTLNETNEPSTCFRAVVDVFTKDGYKAVFLSFHPMNRQQVFHTHWTCLETKLSTCTQETMIFKCTFNLYFSASADSQESPPNNLLIQPPTILKPDPAGKGGRRGKRDSYTDHNYVGCNGKLDGCRQTITMQVAMGDPMQSTLANWDFPNWDCSYIQTIAMQVAMGNRLGR